jgi:hypothetical protein
LREHAGDQLDDQEGQDQRQSERGYPRMRGLVSFENERNQPSRTCLRGSGRARRRTAASGNAGFGG